MTAEELAQNAHTEAEPPEGLSDAERALWLARAGRWNEAHDVSQEMSDAAGAWIHAHLHRKEGDAANAAYWYRRAGKPVPADDLRIEDEWMELARALCR